MLLLPLVAPVQFGGSIDQLQALAPVDVAVFQPAGQRRQVVGAGGGQGVVRPVENRLEMAGLGLLEGQHAHAQHGLGRQLLAQAVRHGAQVFAEDDCLMAHRLQRQQAQQVVQRVVEVGAFAGLGPLRDQPQPAQAHDMVDAQAAGVGEVGPQHFDEGAVAVALEAFGREGADAPVLAGTVEDVGRCTHLQACQQFVLAAPGLAAGTVGAHRQVGDQAHGHAVAAGRFLGALQATFGQPLAEGVELDLGRVGIG
ncbi:hypothetical protein D3C75_724480 [compost metagenome]